MTARPVETRRTFRTAVLAIALAMVARDAILRRIPRRRQR